MRQPQQFGFIQWRSTLDAILSLCLVREVHRTFHKPLHIACKDIKLSTRLI